MPPTVQKILAVLGLSTISVATISAQTRNPGWAITGSLNESRDRPMTTQLRDGKVLIVGSPDTSG